MEIKLSKNGWHSKLQSYVFRNDKPTFHNFCPYFWLTIFCLLITFIFPILPLVRGIKWVLIKLDGGLDKFTNWFEETICEPRFERSALNMDDDELIRSWSIFSRYNRGSTEEWVEYDFWTTRYFEKNPTYASLKKKESWEKKFEIWKNKNSNWEQLLANTKNKRKEEFLIYKAEKEKINIQKREKQIAKEQKAAGSRERKQKMFISIIKYTKWIGIVLVTLLMIKVGYWLYLLIEYIVAHFYLDRFLTVLKFIGLGLLLLSSILFIGYLIKQLFIKFTCKLELKWLSKTFRFLGSNLGLGFKKIGEFILFFWNGIMNIKKDYCPGILWDDEK